MARILFLFAILWTLFYRVFIPAPALANDAEILTLIRDLQKQIEAQNLRIQQLESRKPDITLGSGSLIEKDATLSKTQPAETRQIPVPSDKDFAKKLGESLGGAEKWLKDLSFSGDLRLRYEAFHYSSGQPGSNPDRNRFRFRLRYGFEKKFTSEWKTGFGLNVSDAQTNGTQTDPTSANTTFNNDFSYKNIWIDKAYASYSPAWALVGPVSSFTIAAGKTSNPFERGSKELVWKIDNVRPEGIYETADFNFFKSDSASIRAYCTLGQFVLREVGTYSSASKDSELFAYQVGINPVLSTDLSPEPVELLSALSFYCYPDYAGNSNWTYGGVSQAKGNVISTRGNGTLLDAGDFNVFDTYHEVTVKVFGTPVTPFFEYANNVTDHSTPSGIQGANTAWSTGVRIGKVKNRGDWEANYAYKWIGANSVVGAFADNDFGSGLAPSAANANGGSTGKHGSVVKLGYGLTDFLKMNLTVYLVDPLNSGYTNPANGGTIWDEGVKRFQTDLTWKF